MDTFIDHAKQYLCTDIFDVRGYEREQMGVVHDPVIRERSVHFSYTGVDGRERETHLRFGATPDYLDAASAMFRLTLQRRETVTLRLDVLVGPEPAHVAQVGRFAAVAEDYRRWMADSTQVFTDNEFFNRVLSRSMSGKDRSIAFLANSCFSSSS